MHLHMLLLLPVAGAAPIQERVCLMQNIFDARLPYRQLLNRVPLQALQSRTLLIGKTNGTLRFRLSRSIPSGHPCCTSRHALREILF